MNKKLIEKDKLYILVGFRSRLAITGVSMAFELLLAGFAAQKIPYAIIDLDSLGHSSRIGTFNFRKAVATLRLMISYWIQLWQAKGIYIQIACTPFGFLRDALMVWASRLFNCRLVLHLHGGGYGFFYESQPAWFQDFIALTLTQADAIIVLGEKLCHQFSFVNDIEKKIHIVPNGLPLDLNPKPTASKTLSKPTRLLYLSNLMTSKGYLETLAALRILHHERQLPVHCDFCGAFIQTVADELRSTDDLKTEFFDLVQKWDLAEIVAYHGVIGGESKKQFLQQANIFILPTKYPWEGQPISIIEALAYSIPVIATAQGGIPEQVVDQHNGILVDPEPEDIANAVEKFISDPSFYETLSRNARDYFEDHFTQESHLERIIPIILGEAESDFGRAEKSI